MAYQSVGEIFAAMDETRARFNARIGALGAEEAGARADAEAWTVAEIVEHVSLVEKQIVKLMTLMLMKAETGGARAREDGRIAPVELDQIIERSLREKYQSPETSRPAGNISLGDSLALMSATRTALHELRPRLEAADLTTVSYPHPVFGQFNLYEWLV
ncbi:MAG: DinB family protein, partial [Acidobacteria bacterium]|nr:DinB family protein [Acidobacteriota bacterium]